MKHLEITKPDDWHVHFRDNEILEHTVLATAAHFARALVMPNLKPALTSVDAVLNYHQRILKALNHQFSFTPVMTLYLNETVTPKDIETVKNHSFIVGAKYYPAGATTNAEEGARSIKSLYPLLELMQAQELVLQIHGEVTTRDIFNREALFIEEVLVPLTKDFPKLRMVLEHISTRCAVDFVLQAPSTVAATITPHHLLYNRNHLLAGGIRPHYYCLPLLKTEEDQNALQQAAVSGHPKFFAGTDSAPHAKEHKESACGCAGIYSAPYALAMYAEVFDGLDKLPRLNAFMSQFGADFYQWPRNTGSIELVQNPQVIPQQLAFGKNIVVPVAAGSTLLWSVNASS